MAAITQASIKAGLVITCKEHPAWGQWKVDRRAAGTTSSWEIHSIERGPNHAKVVDEYELCYFWTSDETPEVGQGATFCLWTDCHACTVIEVRRNGKEAVLQRDKATLLNGFNSDEPDALTFTPGGFAGHTSGTQRYSYERDPNGQIIRVSRRTLKNGEVIWKQVGQPTKSPGATATFNGRHEHHDYNF